MIASTRTELSQIGGACFIAAGTFAGLGALAWVHFSEPWYSNQLLKRMQVGAHQAPWRDETARISDLFPDGISQDAAVTLLRQNGFSCGRGNGSSTDALQIECVRKVSGFPCTVSYVVKLAPDQDNERGLRAQSYAACI